MHSTSTPTKSPARSHRLRRLAVGVLMTGALTSVSGVAHANASIPGRGTCVTEVDHVAASSEVTFGPYCVATGMYARVAIYDYTSRAWLWSNWTTADKFDEVVAFNDASIVYGRAYVKYAYYSNGWRYTGEWVTINDF